MDRFSWTRYDDNWDNDYVIGYYESTDFTCIPIAKCASTSIMKTLKLEKYPLLEKEKINDNKFTFTFIRNPYSRLLSCWNGWVRNRPNSRLYKIDGIYRGMEFNKFIESIEEIPNELCDQHFVPYFTSLDGLDVNYIGKIEKMVNHWNELSNLVNIPKSILWKAKTEVGNKYKEYFNRKSIEIVNKKYSKDFHKFKYEKL